MLNQQDADVARHAIALAQDNPGVRTPAQYALSVSVSLSGRYLTERGRAVLLAVATVTESTLRTHATADQRPEAMPDFFVPVQSVALLTGLDYGAAAAAAAELGNINAVEMRDSRGVSLPAAVLDPLWAAL